MQCKNCGKELGEGFAFCDKCGVPVIKENPVEVKTDAGNKPEAKIPAAAQPVTQTVPQSAPQPVSQPVAQPAHQTAVQQPYYGNQPYNQPQQPQPAYPNYQYQGPMQSNMQPVTTIGQYFVWMLVGTIFIVAIIFAIDTSNKNRANFFRAILIYELGLGFLFLIIALAIGATTASLF